MCVSSLQGTIHPFRKTHRSVLGKLLQEFRLVSSDRRVSLFTLSVCYHQELLSGKSLLPNPTAAVIWLDCASHCESNPNSSSNPVSWTGRRVPVNQYVLHPLHRPPPAPTVHSFLLTRLQVLTQHPGPFSLYACFYTCLDTLQPTGLDAHFRHVRSKLFHRGLSVLAHTVWKVQQQKK